MAYSFIIKIKAVAGNYQAVAKNLENGNDSIRCRNSLSHMAPLGLTVERYISHWVTRFGKDSNPGHQHRRPKT